MKIINLHPLKTINCHAEKLPFYCGRNILNWGLIDDEKEFEIIVHYMDEGIDTRDIILQKVYPIFDGDNYQTLLKNVYARCADVLYDVLKTLYGGQVRVIKQNDMDSIGMYCGMCQAGDEIID